MEENRTIIIADDLTGANDTAIQFVKQGFSALVTVNPRFSGAEVYAPYDIISVNSNSRGMSSAGACLAVRDLLRQLKAMKPGGTYYKKIDSVLRGNPGPELSAVMDELAIPLAIVAPSFPANRSFVEQGILRSGQGVSRSEIDAVRIFADTIDKKTENLPLEIIRQGHSQAAQYVMSRYAKGARVFVADAVSEDDLSLVCRISSLIEQPLVFSGAAALASQIALNMTHNEKGAGKPAECFGGCAPVLVIAGTRQGETAAQIASLSRAFSSPVIRFQVDLAGKGRGEEAVRAAYTEAAEQMKENAALCIIAVESMFAAKIPEGSVSRDRADSGGESGAISAALGVLAGELMKAFQFPVLVSTGGDTSLGICRHLGAEGIQPLAEICPGIPIGRIAGGICEGRYIITKSGRFGNQNTLVEIMDYLESKKTEERKEKIL
jgi:uncharacterized protein YgbK (DUF1537 family)